MTLKLERIEVPCTTHNLHWEFYTFWRNGRSQVDEFLRGLQDQDLSAFLARFESFAQRGSIRDNTKFRAIHGHKGIFEFKISSGHRILCFLDNSKCILVEGFKKESKHSRRTNREAYARAGRCRDEYLQWQ